MKATVTDKTQRFKVTVTVVRPVAGSVTRA